MYGLFGLPLNVENIFKVAEPFTAGATVETMADLKPAYISFLRTLHKKIQFGENTELIIRDPEMARRLSAAFSFSVINDLAQETMVADPF